MRECAPVKLCTEPRKISSMNTTIEKFHTLSRNIVQFLKDMGSRKFLPIAIVLLLVNVMVFVRSYRSIPELERMSLAQMEAAAKRLSDSIEELEKVSTAKYAVTDRVRVQYEEAISKIHSGQFSIYSREFGPGLLSTTVSILLLVWVRNRFRDDKWQRSSKPKHSP
jgi:hypothetical protein